MGNWSSTLLGEWRTTKHKVGKKDNNSKNSKNLAKDLDYPQEHLYEPSLADETTAEKRQREQRNIKRKTDWQSQCQTVQDKGPIVHYMELDEPGQKKKV